MMVADLAIFFEVSKQAMRIQLETLGIMANTVPQPEQLRRIDRLTLFDAFSTDKNLQRLLVSGAYWYVDGYIVKNKPQYVENEMLTEYAIEHLEECTLEFKTVRCEGTAEDALLQRYQDYALAPYLSRFEKSDDFETLTGVHSVKLKQFRDGKLNNPEVRTVVAICIGLNLDIVQTMKMLRSAGHILLNTREHWAYKFLITCCEELDIEKSNAVLVSLGIRPLGSRKTTKKKIKIQNKLKKLKAHLHGMQVCFFRRIV